MIVWGAGSLGSCAIAILRALYPSVEIACVARFAAQQALAKQLGASVVLGSDDRLRILEELAAWSGGRLVPTMEGLPGIPMCHPGGRRRLRHGRQARDVRDRRAPAQGARHAREERRARARALGVEPALLQGDPLGRVERVRRRGGRGQTPARHPPLPRPRARRPHRPARDAHAPFPLEEWQRRILHDRDAGHDGRDQGRDHGQFAAGRADAARRLSRARRPRRPSSPCRRARARATARRPCRARSRGSSACARPRSRTSFTRYGRMRRSPGRRGRAAREPGRDEQRRERRAAAPTTSRPRPPAPEVAKCADRRSSRDHARVHAQLRALALGREDQLELRRPPPRARASARRARSPRRRARCRYGACPRSRARSSSGVAGGASGACPRAAPSARSGLPLDRACQPDPAGADMLWPWPGRTGVDPSPRR